MARHARVLDAVEDLIGPSIQLHNSNMHLKLPEHGGEVDWHQDFPYLPHTNFDLLNTMIMLDDSTPENGCLNVIPGSHRWGPLGHGVSRRRGVDELRAERGPAGRRTARRRRRGSCGRDVDPPLPDAPQLPPEPLAQGPAGLDLHVPGGGCRAARRSHELRRLRDAASRREPVPSPARGGCPRPAAREHGSREPRRPLPRDSRGGSHETNPTGQRTPSGAGARGARRPATTRSRRRTRRPSRSACSRC